MQAPTHRRILTMFLAAGLVAGLAACGGDDDDDDGAAPSDDTEATTDDTAATTDDTEPTTDDTEATGGGTIVVSIANFEFEVAGPVAAGASFGVHNNDGATHTFTADDGEFDSGQLDANAHADVTAPSEPGTYGFHCEIHSSMTGELVVE